MKNNFDFKYLVPTPDTTANCALSRWNDSLNGLSEFLKRYMSSRQSLEFGFNRNLNIKELINLSKETVLNDNDKKDYVINYHKYGDLKAYICGFEIPLIDTLHPFLGTNWQCYIQDNEVIESTSIDGVIVHVFNYNSELTINEKITAFLDGLNALKNDVENVMTQTQISTYFNKSIYYTQTTKQNVLQRLNNSINLLNSLTTNAKNFIFGFKNKKEIEESTNLLNSIYIDNNEVLLDETERQLYNDLYYLGKTPLLNNTLDLDINLNESDYINSVYFKPRGIEPIFYDQQSNLIKYNGLETGHLLVYFRFVFSEEPTITPFLSHDGTHVPLSKQEIKIRFSKQLSRIEESPEFGDFRSYWDDDEECPIYYDDDGISHLMTLDSNTDFMGGKDYTFWTSPVTKTDNGYMFECCMPLAFYNEATHNYGNEFYATKQHENIEIGQVLYRVPVVKRLRQNIEEAIVNTHIAKCMSDIASANDNNADDDNTVILGGVVVDDFTQGLYTVAEQQNIASEDEYGEVKITRLTDSNGVDNGVYDLMINYSQTGELTYNDITMPKTGRAIDIITLFDVLKRLNLI